MSKTKAVVFDLGGVLFKEGKTVAIEKLAKEKGYDKEIVLKVLRSPESFDLRLGSISDGQFWNLVQQQLPEGYDALTIKKYWYEGYVLNEEVFELVKKLEGKYKLIIFSGNIKSRVEYLNQKYDFRKHFDLEIYSYDYRLNKYASNKPDPEFIKVLLEKSAVEPEEIFYIDDDQEMIELAKNFGINGFAYSGDIKKLEEKLKL